jgi:hypothetical protein
MFRNISFMMLICQPSVTKDVELCFVLPANQSLIGILYNNGLHPIVFLY